MPTTSVPIGPRWVWGVTLARSPYVSASCPTSSGPGPPARRTARGPSQRACRSTRGPRAPSIRVEPSRDFPKVIFQSRSGPQFEEAG